MLSFASGAITDKGDVRAENQDSILSLKGKRGDQTAALYVVADGIGGLAFGAQVSLYITEQFKRWWHEDFPQLIHEGMDCEADIRELLEQEIWDINQAVFSFKEKMQCRSGSTLSLLLLYKKRYYIENIGDSRIYLFRDRQLCQLTSDQSLAAQMVQDHRLMEDKTQSSKVKNMLTMCIGMFPVPQSRYLSGKLYPGDSFLLCSDGLYNLLSAKQIEEVLGKTELDVEKKPEWLRQLVGRGNAKDNVSAIVVEVRRERGTGK